MTTLWNILHDPQSLKSNPIWEYTVLSKKEKRIPLYKSKYNDKKKINTNKHGNKTTRKQ